MDETATKALDLADKWAQQIGEKLNAAAPGAQEIALEAVKVQIGASLIKWTFITLLLYISYRFCRWAWKMYAAKCADDRAYRNDEEVPFVVMGLVLTVVTGFLMFGSIATFPAREAMGVFAPRGYVALMVFDAVKK